MDIVLTVQKFVNDYGVKLSKGVDIKTWYEDAVQVLDHLKVDTHASTNATELKRATDAWTVLSHFLRPLAQRDDDVHFPGFVEQACVTWWDFVTERQVALSLPQAQAYRAMAGYVLAQLAFRQRDRGTALRWATLGYLADQLGGNGPGSGNEVTLRFGLAVPRETVALLTSLAAAQSAGTGVESLPEWLLPEALNDPLGAALVAPSLVYSHHPSTAFVNAARAYVFDPTASSTQKGERLERFAAFLASTVPGMRPRRRLVASGVTAEHDVVSTLFGDSPYPLPAQATEWLFECKNTKDPVTVEQVGFFLAKMQHAGARFGIIFAKKNVTGGDTAPLQHSYADRFRTEYCLKEDIVCLVIDHDDIYALGEEGTFRTLIDRKYEMSRFGR